MRLFKKTIFRNNPIQILEILLKEYIKQKQDYFLIKLLVHFKHLKQAYKN